MTRIPAIALALLLLTAAPLAAQAPTPRNQKPLVEATKAALVAKGQTFTTNCDAFQITGRVAWALKDQGAQLLTKTDAQNGCVWQGRKYSHDVITFATGWADLLRSAGPPANVNEPDWQCTASGPSAGAVAPIDLDAGSAPVVTPPPVDPPIVPPPAVLLELLGRVLLDLQQLRAEQAGTTDALAKVRSDLTDLRILWSHGLTGEIFRGYPITLKPAP